MSDALDFVDAALQRESGRQRAADSRARLGEDLDYYGCSVGAIRGALRDVAGRYPAVTGHDPVVELASELWSSPVYERRLAAVILLQTQVALLDNTDLTRLEGFLRDGGVTELVDTLAVEILAPMISGLWETGRGRAEAALTRWASSDNPWLRRAAAQTREHVSPRG
ncbi:MAG: DNA alkylation repair protein [Microbacteriaceae bacterium]|nr:DNA alkylation repair protein [Microbacteriaceae bacterium]